MSVSLSACGLRVDHPATLAGSAGSGLTGPYDASVPTTGPTTGPGPGVGVQTPGDGSTGTTVGEGVPGTVPGASGGPTATTPGAAGSSRAKGPLVVGFQVTKNLQAAFLATGAQGKAPDEQAMVQALVKWVNDTGGIHGRQLQAVIHVTDITSGTFAAQASAACADFTQDHHVLVVATSPVTPSDDLTRCVAGKGVPVIEQDLWPYDSTYYRQYPGLIYSPGRASPDRWASAAVDVLDGAGYFSKSAKVGLVRFDAPVYTRMAASLKAAMAARGHSFAQEAVITTPGSLSDLGAMSAPINQAILTFQGAGIDHVMFAASGELPFFFMTQAESQHYRPRYGLTTNDVPQTQVGQGVPSAQFTDSLVVGWEPPNDVGEAHYPNHSGALGKCLGIMAKYGVTANGYYSDSHCDSMFLLRRVLEQLPVFSVAGMRSAVEGWGTSYLSPLTFATAFGPGRFDGPSQVRLATYGQGCGCYTYTGPLRPM